MFYVIRNEESKEEEYCEASNSLEVAQYVPRGWENYSIEEYDSEQEYFS